MTVSKAQRSGPASSRTRASRNKTPVSQDAPPKSVRRRDGGGHMDPSYRSELLRLSSRPPPASDAVPFIGSNRSSDELAEQLGEDAIVTATTGEWAAPDAFDVDAPEELVSPFRDPADPDEDEEED